MTLNPQLAAAGERHGNAADRSSAAVNIDTFVINLCSSTTPMALVQPDTPELKRFRFFVSRRLEDGRERFRLHMGYFQSLEEAEDWLSVVRDVYPGAWAGETPGKRLRAREGTPPPAPSAESKVAPAQESVPDTTRQALPVPQSTAPSAAPVERSAAAAAYSERPRSAAPSAAPPPVPTIAASALAKQAPPAAPLLAASAPVISKQPPSTPTVARRRDVAATTARNAPMAPLSNVREVLAALDESDTGHVAPKSTPRTATAAMSAAQSLTDTQVMQILEARRTEEPAHEGAENVPSGIPLLRPDDSGTRQALRSAVQDNAAVAFAVQLQWSVQPLALDKVPPLAIFSAYTLYTVEGRREGREWYGLRLGFFNDATAAKQVAHYVRSDFASVAVVPVSLQERGRATSADHKTPIMSVAEPVPAKDPDEITLLDSESEVAPRPPAAPTSSAKPASEAARAAAVRSKKLRSKGLAAHSKGPYSLEETLEILGAGSLEIDDGRGEIINESGVRHLRVEVRKDSAFQRLLTRLTERARKS
ncbi:MAG TPA: hypothetical protein VK820_01485 [Steroidobacteraceae bacterium]|jgi:hypothetical protein|nr:hypothetical protein [Steroidobacteraceae bacterium]